MTVTPPPADDADDVDDVDDHLQSPHERLLLGGSRLTTHIIHTVQRRSAQEHVAVVGLPPDTPRAQPPATGPRLFIVHPFGGGPG